MKRKGTRDTQPQLINFTATQSGVDTTTTTTITLPPGIGLTSTGSGNPRCIEILKILWYLPTPAGAASSSVRAYLSNKNWAAVEPTNTHADATVLASILVDKAFSTAAAWTLFQAPIVVDYTDGMGNGMLYGNQNIYVTVATTATGGAAVVKGKILYREKTVPTNELIGMVLSAQG